MYSDLLVMTLYLSHNYSASFATQTPLHVPIIYKCKTVYYYMYMYMYM